MNVDLTLEHITAIKRLRDRWPGTNTDTSRDVAVLETLLPRPIAVGDTVSGRYDRYGDDARVLCIDGDTAWVKYDDGSRYARFLNELTRVAS